MSKIKGIDLLSIHPTSLVNRYIVGYTIRNVYTPQQVAEMNPEFVLEFENEEGNPDLDIDWEYYFFIATDAQVQYLIAQLHDKYSPQKGAESIPDEDETLVQKISTLQSEDEVNKIVNIFGVKDNGLIN